MGQSSSKFEEFDDVRNIQRDDIDECMKGFEDGGWPLLNEKINEHLNRWKQIKLNIAVTGNTGVGKSSFINAFRGLNAEDEEVAKVGVTEATAFPTKYIHPKNPNIALWDLPGVGGIRFPRETYLQNVGFTNYDFYVIICAGRFTENDLWLAKSANSVGKKFYFVRTKIHQDFENQKKSHPSSFLSKELLREMVYDDCMGNLRANGFEETNVFIIDNYVPEEYDFGSLMESILEELPSQKVEAMLNAINSKAENITLKKKKQLKRRIWFVALGSAAAGLVPVPGFSVGVDIAIITGEIYHYKNVLGLDDLSLERAAKELNTSKEALETKLSINIGLLAATASSIVSFSSALGAAETAKMATKIVLPIIGSVIGAGTSYGVTVAILRSILDLFVQYSLNIGEELRKKTI